MKLKFLIPLLAILLSVPAMRAQNRFDGGYMWEKFKRPQVTKASDGVYRILVIPAQYKDVSFFYGKENFVRMLTDENYGEFGAEGSARQYLEKQLGCKVEITVADIVTVSQERIFYGKNDANGNDSHPGTFIAEACIEAAKTVDFSLFDVDGDGKVENVFVFFAGEDEAQCRKEHPEFMWSHSYNLQNSDYQKTLTLNGVVVNNYACSSEIFRKYTSAGNFDSNMAPIGTFCHEYLHNFGLPDFYDTDYEKSGGISAGVWGVTSLMASGNYNNSGNTPANLNSIERMILGLNQPQPLTAGDYTLYPVGHEKFQSYRLDNPENQDEYYLFEARSLEGWDRFIGMDPAMSAGLLVYHIDRRKDQMSFSDAHGEISSFDRWNRYNQVNANPKNQCADLVEADSRVDIDPTDASLADIKGIYFPSMGASALGGEAKIKLSFRGGKESDFAVRNIREAGGVVNFTVVNLVSPIPVPPVDPPKDDSMLYIIVLVNPDKSLSLRASNEVDAWVEWYYDSKPIEDPSSFRPGSDGTICAEITWPDGSTDYLFKEHKLAK